MGLSLENITRSFGAVEAVADASLSVADGEIVCLFGPSGCGKTTFLRVAAGFEPHGGIVRLGEQVLAGGGVFLAPEKRPIGFVFQDYVLFPHLSVSENVAFGLQGLCETERQARTRSELSAVGLLDLIDRYPHQLSGGQQQRVALARAFARRPRAMLLDEPFASIDPSLRRQLREEFRLLLKSTGAATLLVTHDAEEALALGDRIALMRDGKIVETAAPEDLYFRPKTIHAAMMFPAAQKMRGRVSNGALQLGFCDAPAEAPDGAKEIVILPGGLVAQEGGDHAVLDCRFAPPGWSATVAVSSGTQVTALSQKPLSAGSNVALRLDPASIRLFPAD